MTDAVKEEVVVKNHFRDLLLGIVPEMQALATDVAKQEIMHIRPPTNGEILSSLHTIHIKVGRQLHKTDGIQQFLLDYNQQTDFSNPAVYVVAYSTGTLQVIKNDLTGVAQFRGIDLGHFGKPETVVEHVIKDKIKILALQGPTVWIQAVTKLLADNYDSLQEGFILIEDV